MEIWFKDRKYNTRKIQSFSWSCKFVLSTLNILLYFQGRKY